MKPTHLVASLIVLTTAAHADPTPAARADAPLVVPPSWLAAHLKDRNLVLLHVGEIEAYRKKHIPGARHVGLDDISVSADSHEGPTLELPPEDQLRKALEGLGISSDSRVVVYFGEDWVSPATRVILTLDAVGLGGQVSLLDGGMPAWVAAGQQVTDAAARPGKGKLAPLVVRPIIVDATAVVASLGKPGVAVVDARDKPFYDGTRAGGMPTHPQRAGHVAGALSIPFQSVFDDKNQLRSAEDLRERFTKAGVKPGDTIIGYCHIGQQATAMLFAARRLGHPVKLYDGSFEDWSQRAGYPVEKSQEAKPETKADATPGARTDAKPDARTDAKPGSKH